MHGSKQVHTFYICYPIRDDVINHSKNSASTYEDDKFQSILKFCTSTYDETKLKFLIEQKYQRELLIPSAEDNDVDLDFSTARNNFLECNMNSSDIVDNYIVNDNAQVQLQSTNNNLFLRYFFNSSLPNFNLNHGSQFLDFLNFASESGSEYFLNVFIFL